MNKKAISSILIISILLISSLGFGCLDMAITGLSGSPIAVNQWNHDEVSEYWVGSAIVSGAGSDTSFLLTMPAGTSDGDTTTQEDIQIKLEAITPYWQAPLEPDYSDPLTFTSVYYPLGDWLTPGLKYFQDVPYQNVGAGQLVTGYKITASTSDGVKSAIGTSRFSGESPLVSIPVTANDGKTYNIRVELTNIVNVDGTIPPATTGYSVIEQYRLVSTNDLEGAVHDWNNHVIYEFSKRPSAYYYLFDYSQIDSWNDAINWMQENNKIPDRAVGLGGYPSISESQIKLTYNDFSFAPQVTFYIPAQIAETITLDKPAPVFEFDKIPDIEAVEGGSARIKVSGDSIGSNGQVTLTAHSDIITTQTWTPTGKPELVAGQSETFYVNIGFSDTIDANKEYPIKLTSQGGWGDPTETTFNVYLADNDVSDMQKHTLTVKAVYEGTDDMVETAPIFEGYGANAQMGRGESSRDLIAGIEYSVYGANVTGWYPKYTADHPLTVDLTKDSAVEIPYSTTDKSGNGNGAFDITNYVFGAILLVFIFILWYVGIIEWIISTFSTNPVMILMIAIIIVLLWLGFQVQSAADAISTSAESINPINWFR